MCCNEFTRNTGNKVYFQAGANLKGGIVDSAENRPAKPAALFFSALCILGAAQPNSALATSGDFKTTDFAAAAPYTYNHDTGGGAYNDRTVGDFSDITEQLEGGQFSCGDIVTYLSNIEMEAATVDVNQSVRLSFSFLANSTGQAGAAHSEVVGVSLNYGSVENGDNGTGSNPGEGFFGLDSAMNDDGNSTVNVVSSGLNGPLFQAGSELELTVDVDDLEAGESVVLRIDTRLSCQSGSSPTGNLQGQLVDVIALVDGSAAGSGAQTIPFLKVGDIAGAGEPLLSITKTVTTSDGVCGTDDVEELAATDGDTVKYCYVIENFGTADLFGVEVVDDNATPGDPTDDFTLISGINLAGGASTATEATVTIDLEGSNPMTLVNTAEATGNNGLSGGKFQVLTDSDTATVNASPIPNRPPVANDDFETVLQGQSVNIDASGNDSDPDGNLDPTSTTVTSGPSNGSLINNGDGSFSYTPDTGFIGADSFTYEICDSEGLCDTANVTITVTEAPPVNSPPDAVTDAVDTDEATMVLIDAALNDTDPDGNLDPATANTACSTCTTPQHGALVNNGDGTFSYTPTGEYNGPDSFIYEICDTDGECDTATVNISVLPVNDPPVAEDDTAATDEDTSVNIPVVANDNDIDGNLDFGSITILSGPSNGTAEVQEDGSIDYTPNANFNGEDLFTYQICDTDGLCDSATVTVTVHPVNDAPTATADAYETAEDTELTVDAPGVLGNDSDVDGDSLTVNLVSQPSNGTLTQNPDGSLSYIPDANFNGVDSYTYQACDTSGGCSEATTVTINVTPVNDNPDAVDDQSGVNEDASVDIAVLSNDSDADGDSLTVTDVSDPANGSAAINPDGTVHYQPDAEFCGQDTLTYSISDGNGGSDTATVAIDVACINDPPLANDDTAGTDEDTAVVIAVQDNDNAGPVDEDQNLTTTEVTDPANGTASINPDGTVTYTPDPNYYGQDNFSYTVCDSDGLCDTATVTVTIGAENDAPVAVDDAYNTAEDTVLNVTAPGVLGNDSDVDGDTLTVNLLTNPSNGIITQNADGSFSYLPNENFNGTDSYTYEACDPDGLCDMATVTITVDPVNDAPIARNDAYTTPEDTELTVDPAGILGNDSDEDGDALTVNLLTGPSNGTLTQNADGSFTYMPNADFNGNDIYTYEACDSSGACAEAAVTVSVNPVNDKPAADDDAYSTDEDTELTLSAPGVLGNDSDVDGDTLTVSLLTDPSNGIVTQNPDGSFTYIPHANFNGADSYTYEACDPSGLCDTATVVITVNPVNDDPAAIDDQYITAQNTSLEQNGVLANDSDPDGDELSAASGVYTSSYGGSFSINPDGSFNYIPPVDFAGYDTVEYTVTDGNGGTDTAVVTIEVTAKNGRSISVSWGDWSLVGTMLDGTFHVNNQSGNYDVQLQGFEIIIQYRETGPGKKEWINVAVEGCNFDPIAPTMLVDELWIDFDSCELQDAIPAGSTVRVTAVTGIYGHKDKGKQKQTFLSRLSKTL